MGDKTGIEWTGIKLADGREFRGATWNPIAAFDAVTGKRGWFCVRVSQGCKHCYAATLNKRLGNGYDYAANYLDKMRFEVVNLDLPLRWTAPRGIFVNSMTDLFGEFVTDQMIDAIFAVMALSPGHIFQVLTKRPARMVAYFQRPDLYDRVLTEANKLRAKRPTLTGILISNPSRFPLFNVWLGVSVEDQKTADERIPLLLQTPAAVRWISAEPLLGPVSLRSIPLRDGGRLDALKGIDTAHQCHYAGKLDWLVAGGESGPMHPDWARSLRNQCQAAGVAYFFKQWGEVIPSGQWRSDTLGHPLGELAHQAMCEAFGDRTAPRVYFEDGTWGYRIGKKRAGRLLDGVEWNQYPDALGQGLEVAHG